MRRQRAPLDRPVARPLLRLPSLCIAAFAFPFGEPSARARVRLLGPCFKTGRRGQVDRVADPGVLVHARYPRPELEPPGHGPPRTRQPEGRQRNRGFAVRATSIRVGPVTTFFDRRTPWRAREGRHDQPGTNADSPARLLWRDFGRFRVLFHSLFRVLFDFPSRYLFAIGLAICVEPRMGRTTRKASGCVLKRPDSRDDEQTGGYGRARCGPGTLDGPHPFGNRLALFHRPASSTCRRPTRHNSTTGPEAGRIRR